MKPVTSLLSIELDCPIMERNWFGFVQCVLNNFMLAVAHLVMPNLQNVAFLPEFSQLEFCN